jgi:hypothetical protein
MPHHFCWKEEFEKIPPVLGKMMVEQLDKKECKFADAIEELCDRFVYVPKGKEDSWISIFVNLPDNLKEEKDYYYYTYDIYGAIWNDKGLIYVAKMNDKGELELL